ncbi:hypothetical protein IKG16_00920, partial [Candidatus Saccharibacteria bacterium]|nr:hypothetical protein [Candidatus Saccharibacteria bacterium]
VNTVNLTDCTEITAEVSSTSYRGATCSYTGNLPVGTYNVTLTSSWHNATYVLPNSFIIYKTIQDITYMQEMTTDICNRMSKNQTATLQDPRGSYNTTTPANYGIIKAKDGNCWMTDNLNLYNRQISNVDSDLPVNTTILLPDTSNWTGNIPSSIKIHRGVGTGYSNYVYYNWCAVVGLSSTCSTSEQQNQSICPKNWQLPINGNEDTDKTYAKLLKAYNITNGTELIANTILGFKSEGYYDAVYGLDMLAYGVNGQGWTSTPSIDGQSAYYLLYWHSENNNSVTPQYLNYKDFAFTTRCVAR